MSDVATTYAEALTWLFVQTRANAPRDPGRTRALLSELSLQPPKPAVHVVGTNGKGTVANLIARGLSLAGERTGLFTSPHVEDFRERISVDGTRVTEAAVLAFVQRAQRLERSYAFFELCFALASEHFAAQKVDSAVIEAGVGARNDATRVLEEVRAVVITNVSFDHQDTLGETLSEIAADKAEAIRSGVPTFTGAQGDALQVIKEVARKRGSPLHSLSDGDPLFDAPEEHPHRLENLRLALAVLRTLGVEEKRLAHVLTTPPLPGRREVFSVQGKTVILDGGHNPAAAKALQETLQEPYILLFGALAKKQGAQTLAVLESRAHATILTQAAGQIDAELITPERRYIPDPVKALERGLELCPENGRVLIAGSLYLAGELRPYLRDGLSPFEEA